MKRFGKPEQEFKDKKVNGSVAFGEYTGQARFALKT